MSTGSTSKEAPTTLPSKVRIERAAISLFSKHGIDGVSTKEIAKIADLSEGSIYRHFKSKDALAKALMQSIHMELTQMIREAAELPLLQDQIAYIVKRYCEIADTDWDLFRYHILHLYHFPNLSDTQGDNPQTAASDLLRAAMARGDIPKRDASILASMALGVVLQTAHSKVLGFIETPLSIHAPLFTRTVMTIIQQNSEG